MIVDSYRDNPPNLNHHNNAMRMSWIFAKSRHCFYSEKIFIFPINI